MNNPATASARNLTSTRTRVNRGSPACRLFPRADPTVCCVRPDRVANCACSTRHSHTSRSTPMIHRIFRLAAVSALIPAAVFMVALHAAQAPQTPGRDRSGEWTYYGGDARNWRYKPFDQINASNFNTLQVAWRFKTDNLGPSPDYRLGATPIMANGVVYAVGGGMRRSVVAFDAATGSLLWIHTEDEGLRAEFAPRVGAGRGVTYWTDGREERIFYVTTGYRLKALNAKTGALIPSFGGDGVIDLKKDFDQDLGRFAKPYADAL